MKNVADPRSDGRHGTTLHAMLAPYLWQDQERGASV